MPPLSSSGSTRSQILALRRSLSDAETQDKSAEVCANFLTVLNSVIPRDFLKGKAVGIYRTRYSALPGELNPISLESALIEQGATLLYPRVESSKQTDGILFRSLEFAPATLDDHWTTGAYGLQEPTSHCAAISPADLDLIFVPGVVFGRSGDRIGMGGGYYDRYLAKAPQAYRISLAFDFQLVEGLEQESWDQRVDWIITQSESVCVRKLEAVSRVKEVP
ncbi:MAG: 5-formyltetrahydrofolate cyclo-ligase [Methylotenera sp.]|nr:5-formyltetrahydrofolate cyclo-ligase [Oligoflexia bacterium]